MTEPQEYDADLNTIPRNQLGEIDPMHDATSKALDYWATDRYGYQPANHGLGTFLELLAAEGYRVTPIEVPDVRVPTTEGVRSMERYTVPIEQGRARCAFMGDTPGRFQCETPAAVHLWLEHDTFGDVDSYACAEHVAIARQALPVVDEHEFGGVCGMPGTLWDFDEHCCHLDDSGVELPAKATELVGAPCLA